MPFLSYDIDYLLQTAIVYLLITITSNNTAFFIKACTLIQQQLEMKTLIDRKELARRHNPVLTEIDLESPISLGNGNFAFTADVTGLQTLYHEYDKAHAPLCTMSQWGWHSKPNRHGGKYTLDDLQMTEYDLNGRKYRYAVERKPGNEEVYDWLRHNPHKFNLAKISLSRNGKAIQASEISEVRQELDLYSGILRSSFNVLGDQVSVVTACAQSADVLGFHVTCPAGSKLDIEISFPYASHETNGSHWANPEGHTTEIDGSIIKRKLDEDRYLVRVFGEDLFVPGAKHTLSLALDRGEAKFALGFFENETGAQDASAWDFDKVVADAAEGWAAYWQKGAAVDFSSCTEPRAMELERRIVLSQYLTAVHSAGDLPPQETGLMCNSWYGKFHLEMHFIHSAQFALWGRGEWLERSLAWYFEILDKAKENAARNGYKGARWPKMISYNGEESPSPIGTLLIWQQPHVIHMLELLRAAKQGKEREAFMEKCWPLMKETADFMEDFAQLNPKTGKYDLSMPLIPAQEEHKPEITKNPTFELAYWRFGLHTAAAWAKELNHDGSMWTRVCEGLAELPIKDGLYLAHENCPDTFEHFNRDHPSMLFGYGFIPNEPDRPDAVAKTYEKVKRIWDFSTMWGWDFAFIAMALTAIGRREEAVDMLLMETAKNSYVASGNNYQKGRTDLPLYLPGNGSLLFAVAVMLANNGFPQDGGWEVRAEGFSFSA
ncbi:glycoside hydrolase family 65 [Cohnella cellulosilytica]|uniref:glycoside hydrolase family 65 n=1 Tax=Cohnella cellulosilytica TaxID=986710 RepID=UPI0035E8F44D